MGLSINPETDALLVIDIQNDFIPGGMLQVAGGHEIIPGVASLASQFKTIILSQDWHPENHASFASNHPGAAPFTQVQAAYGPQTLWPDHCVQGTSGAEFHPDLHACGLVNAAALVVRKGMNPDIDSYSAFFENDGVTPTGLAGALRERGIKRVVCVGLAYDFCVGFSALDAVKSGFEAVVVKDLTRAIAAPVSETRTTADEMDDRLAQAGVILTQLADVAAATRRSNFKGYAVMNVVKCNPQQRP